MKIAVQQSTAIPRAEVLALAIFQDQQLPQHPWWVQLPAEVKKSLSVWFKKKHEPFGFLGIKVFHFVDEKIPTVVVLGLGNRKMWGQRRDRLLSRRFIRLAHEHRWEKLTLLVQKLTPTTVQQMVESFIMAEYDFNKFRQTPPHGWPKVQTVTIVTKKKARGIDQAIQQAQIVGQAVNACRDLSNTPGGNMTPKILAAAAKTVAKQKKVKVKILNVVQMKKLKMGAVLGVAQGSQEPPKFIIMEYRGLPSRTIPSRRSAGHPSLAKEGISRPLVFVGKGVTFDSGGLNLKPTSAMDEMYMDMAGGAAVINAVRAIAALRLPVNVVGLVPAVENMLSGGSYRPGDVLRSMSGKTIEIGNTDAEGRVILADALTYAQKFYQPSLVVDVATLTGAAIVALGQQASALFTRDDELMKSGQALGELSGDYVWPLPLWDEYASEVKGTFGDVNNSGPSRWGGAINGGMFLYQFIKKTPWIHLDIAPTMTSVEGQFLAKGASGVAVRWLVALAHHFKNGKVVVENT